MGFNTELTRKLGIKGVFSHVDGVDDDEDGLANNELQCRWCRVVCNGLATLSSHPPSPTPVASVSYVLSNDLRSTNRTNIECHS